MDTKNKRIPEDNLHQILTKLPGKISNSVKNLPRQVLESLEEIRISTYGNITVRSCGKEYFAQKGGAITPKDVEEILNNLLNYSYYAYEEELAKGYITIEGGHRVGVCGRGVIEKGEITLIKDISSLNLRRSREITGVSDKIIKYIAEKEDSRKNRSAGHSLNLNENITHQTIYNTLIVSPPKCGKTTLLRDIARNLSYQGYKVGVCDERSEIAGSYLGKASFDLGPRTDILDGCPKSKGIIMLIRSMSPEIIVTDEIGKEEDIKAIEAALCAGVKIITTIHGSCYEDVLNSPIGEVVRKGVFQKIIFLWNNPSTGTVKEVVNG